MPGVGSGEKKHGQLPGETTCIAREQSQKAGEQRQKAGEQRQEARKENSFCAK